MTSDVIPTYVEIFKEACKDKYAFAQSRYASDDGLAQQTAGEAKLVRAILADAEGHRKRSLQYFMSSIDDHDGDPVVSYLIGRYIATCIDHEIGINVILEQCVKKGEYLREDPFFETAMIMAGGNRTLAILKSEDAQKGEFDGSELAEKQRDNIGKGLNYAYLNTMPRSGSMYMSHHLGRVYGTLFFRIASPGFPESHLIEEKVRILSKGGLWDQGHLNASEGNLDILEANGVSRILLHVRDPRQATLSWAHHSEREMVGPNAHLRLRMGNRVPRDYDDRAWDEKLQWHAENWLPVLVEWTKRWVDVQSNDPRFRIKLSEFRNLKERPIETINGMFELFDIPFRTEEVLETRPGLAHFRKGSVDEWQDVFSIKQKETMGRLIPVEMKTMFGWIE